MNREKPVLRTRLGEDTLDHIMRIKIIGASLDNFNTEKFVSDWTDSTVTLRHLYGHNSSRTETHEEADENITFLRRQNKTKTLQDYFVCIYFFSYLDDVKFFSTSRYELLDCYNCRQYD